VPCFRYHIRGRELSSILFPKPIAHAPESMLVSSTGGAEAVLTGFGRAALFLALESAAVAGADVLVPDFICDQVPQAVRRAGASPVFYRVTADLQIVPAALEGVATRNVRAAIVPHYFGALQPAIPQLASWCAARNIVLVEDCALALGGTHHAGPAGSFGDFAIFSFSKSDWCFGGGAVVARNAVTPRLRELACLRLHPNATLQRNYGILRRADFAANRPRLAGAASFAGRWLERVLRCREDNFFDSGRLDAAATSILARRVVAILAGLQRDIALRRALVSCFSSELSRRLGAKFSPLHIADPENSSAAFLMIETPPGAAGEWFEAANRRGVSLRMVWPAYQEAEVGQASRSLDRLSGSLLYLEIHPRLTRAEVECIASVVADLSIGRR
jgi:dTDP-4-amino-4,6-dideoxygalactose transaminase